MSSAARKAAPKPEEIVMAQEPNTDIAEEYASVTIVIDHLALRSGQNGHTVVKDVWSTESAAEALLAQIDYFGQTVLLRDPGTIGMIAKANDAAAAFVYTVSEDQTNVIVDLALWTETFGKPDLGRSSVLGTHASFITLATELKRAAATEGKSSSVLAFISEN